MEYRPDREKAADICKALLDTAQPLLDRETDPEGRTLSLGVAMFAGIFMSTMTDEVREQFTQAALGYSYRTDDILELMGVKP